mgnify:CR=1 FL=1
MSELIPLPAFRDNYIWTWCDDQGRCLVVDPGEAGPVHEFLRDGRHTLTAILATHHHPDHVGGIAELVRDYDVPVHGPAHESVPGNAQPLEDGAVVELQAPALRFRVLHIPGHTLGHIAFYSEDADPPLLFCGDTLFAAGCGKLFEGTPEQMLASLDRLAELDPDTRVCCGHEYTLNNLRFALAVTPDDDAVRKRYETVEQLRENDRVTLPSTLAEETRTNPFLRVDDAAVQTALRERAHGNDRAALFAALRQWKDQF